MRLSRTFILLILLSLTLCQAAKKGKDEDFSEFDDFDQDEFEIGNGQRFCIMSTETLLNRLETPSSSPTPSASSKTPVDGNNAKENSAATATIQTKEDEVTIDDDDDESMFDDEEFEAVSPSYFFRSLHIL